MHDTLQEMMHEAAHFTRTGRAHEATRVIQRALSLVGAPRPAEAGRPPWGLSKVAEPHLLKSAAAPCVAVDAPIDALAARDQGHFASGNFTHAAQHHRYKLYTPPGAGGRHLPLVVMLHGCSHDAESRT